MRDDLLKGLTEEQIKKLKECKTQEEIISLAKEEGVELTDEQLASVSGGGCRGGRCPRCGSDYTCCYAIGKYECSKCQYHWGEDEYIPN